MVAEMDVLTKQQSLIIIGLGNELLSDDGVGIRVMRELKLRISTTNIVFEELSVGGLQLLDYLTGYKHCIIIDAVITGNKPPGTLYRFAQEGCAEPIRLTSSHQIDLSQAIGLAKLMKLSVPDSIVVYGVEAGDITTFSSDCTEPVKKAIPRLVGLIYRDIFERDNYCNGIPAAASRMIPGHSIDNWEVISLA